ncbi:flagellar motor switch phosphatase FliY [Clostridiales bacterium COT073_COT-073]|nr:flagellar motor switch phosphatase FliY [Clostridiales bacterium COT073_COT-073]
MSDLLSQEEINALLQGREEGESGSAGVENLLEPAEQDAIGEVSNISMGAAATSLSTLVNQKVTITTPRVSIVDWDGFVAQHTAPYVTVQLSYKEGLEGNNILVLLEEDAKVITDLMMGGDGTNISEELNDLHLSAISEAMNQMIGASATALSSMFKKKIDILPPVAAKIDLQNEKPDAVYTDDHFIEVDFSIKIGDLIDNTLSQIYPLAFAKEVIETFMEHKKMHEETEKKVVSASQSASVPAASTPQPIPQINYTAQVPHQPSASIYSQPVEVQPAQFQNFEMASFMQQKENIDLIMDVQLEVTVELGRTKRSIKDILELAPGSIIELNKLSGEPIDILVNGKIVAKGEVVVIEENFSIRVTEILK